MTNNLIKHSGDIIMYQTDDGSTKVEVVFGEDTVWLTQEQIAPLFQKGRSTITEHINNIFAKGEINEAEVMTSVGNANGSHKA